MLEAWREGVLNRFDRRYTNGYVEGKINRTKQLQRQATAIPIGGTCS